MKKRNRLSVSGNFFIGALVLTALVGFARPSKAEVPEQVQTAITNTTDTIAALAPIGLAAVSAALVPFGSKMALKFVGAVLSKA